jgi:hypothetical protein
MKTELMEERFAGKAQNIRVSKVSYENFKGKSIKDFKSM